MSPVSWQVAFVGTGRSSTHSKAGSITGQVNSGGQELEAPKVLLYSWTELGVEAAISEYVPGDCSDEFSQKSELEIRPDPVVSKYIPAPPLSARFSTNVQLLTTKEPALAMAPPRVLDDALESFA